MNSGKKKVVPKSRRQLGGTKFALNKHRQQSKRLGHPPRQIVPPRKYVNTSTSETEKVNASRCDNLNQTINVENDINRIRNILETNTENEAAATHISQYASPSMINNCPIPMSNGMAPFYTPPNVNGSPEEYVPQNKKTFTDLLPLRSTLGFNENYVPNNSLYGFVNPRNETYYNPATTTTTPQTNQAIYRPPQQNSYVPPNINQQENSMPLIPDRRITHSNNVTATMGHGDNGSQDTEIRCLLKDKLNNVASKEEFEALRKELTEYFKSINTKLDKLLHKRTNIMPPKPPSFPLQSVQQVTDFNNISQEEYENAVQYLHYIGGFTLHDAIKYCMKEVMTDETIQHYSAWGERGNLPLFDTKLVKVIYDAVCMNSHFPTPLRDEFFREVGEAVRFGKQRNRNVARRNREEIGRRQRLRLEAENYLLGEPQNPNNDPNVNDPNVNDPNVNDPNVNDPNDGVHNY